MVSEGSSRLKVKGARLRWAEQRCSAVDLRATGSEGEFAGAMELQIKGLMMVKHGYARVIEDD